MMMGMLEAGGLELVVDGIRAADEDNPRGYYEFERVKEGCSRIFRDCASKVPSFPSRRRC